ncbi:MAG: imidazole glycerol phosphate synthase subunit HisH [Candidatus Natronoplasma sp.]
MIAIVDLGIGNLSNVEKVLHGTITDDPYEIEKADKLVIPGVGNFNAAKERLGPLKGTIIDFMDEGKPYLGICLGMQVLFGYNEEGKTEGLGILEGDVRKIDGRSSPHIGWNTVKFLSESELYRGIKDGAFFYFVHSYYVDTKGIVIGETEFGPERDETPFPSVVNSDNIYGTQFHPEKSGKTGIRLLKNFKEIGGEVS